MHMPWWHILTVLLVQNTALLLPPDKCMLGHVNGLQAVVSQNKTQLRVLEEAGHTHQRSQQLQPANSKLDLP